MTVAEQQALREKVAALEAERERERAAVAVERERERAAAEALRQADLDAKAAAVRRVWSRAEWAATLSLPASEHRDRCPAERIEAFDNSAGGRTIRCIDCGGQAIFRFTDQRTLED